MSTYYCHKHGCGTGSTKSYVKIDLDGQVTINLRSAWMGSGRLNYDLSCTLFPIDKTYNIIKVNKFTELCKDQNKVYNNDTYFDTYIFDEPLDTEWDKLSLEDVPIGLYMGSGCHSVETFQLSMHINNTILTNINDEDSQLYKVVNVLNGLKYELVTEEIYNKQVTL